MYHTPTKPSDEALEYIRSKYKVCCEDGIIYSQTGTPIIGKSTNGYIILKVKHNDLDGHRYLGHHIVWYFHYGEWPKTPIDHIDRNKANNKISNLRESNQSLNALNKGLIRECLPGTYKCKIGRRIRYAACIKSRWLGHFGTQEEAHNRYKKEYLKEYGVEFNV